jgi:ribosomal protein S18 acetylase RimI-like enzyme
MDASVSFTIRPCQTSEAELLSALGARLFAQAYGPTHPEPGLGAYLAEAFGPELLREKLASPGTRVLLAEDASGQPFGYALLRESDGPVPDGVRGERPAEVVRFYVDAAWHGQGVAPALMTACEAEAVRRGADVLWLAVWTQAARPVAFYRRVGFEAVGMTQFRFGERLDDDYVMAKPLPSGAPSAG